MGEESIIKLTQLKLNLNCLFELSFENIIFENCFELPLASPTNVIKQVLFKSCYITTFPGGGGVGGGGGINNKANSVKFQLKLPV